MEMDYDTDGDGFFVELGTYEQVKDSLGRLSIERCIIGTVTRQRTYTYPDAVTTRITPWSKV